jgi:sigma-E factor negative regulatory protein RseA
MKQQLSALVDGEVDVERCEHIFLAAKSTGEVAQAWRDYHIIRDVMRDEAWMQSDMTSRIMGALENEPTVLAPQAVAGADKVTHIPPRLSKYSWSIAASVAAAFFVGMFVLDQPEVGAPAQIADNDTEQYVLAHHNYAPTSVTYYTQNVSYTAGE